MKITSHIDDTPPRDAATVILLREGDAGMEVLLLKRHTDSKDLGGAFVFPGGNVTRQTAHPQPWPLCKQMQPAFTRNWESPN